MRIRVLALAALALSTTLAVGGCSTGGSGSKAAATTPKSVPSAPPSTFSPANGPVEAASQLPQECSNVLSTSQLQAVFGPGMPIGQNYASYAALPSIGRTGRMACIFGVGIDSFGHQSNGVVEVSIATYTSAPDAVGRAADTVQQDSNAGATTATVSVGGHPATIVVEQNPVGASSSPAAPAVSVPAVPPSPGAPATPTGQTTAASSTASAGPANGETQLVMADGNRTFVLQVPFSRLSPQQAVTSLAQLALEVYQNTMPPAGASTTASPSKA